MMHFSCVITFLTISLAAIGYAAPVEPSPNTDDGSIYFRSYEGEAVAPVNGGSHVRSDDPESTIF